MKFPDLNVSKYMKNSPSKKSAKASYENNNDNVMIKK